MGWRCRRPFAVLAPASAPTAPPACPLTSPTRSDLQFVDVAHFWSALEAAGCTRLLLNKLFMLAEERVAAAAAAAAAEAEAQRAA